MKKKMLRNMWIASLFALLLPLTSHAVSIQKENCCGKQNLCNEKPWSVRFAESEMIRCPESWQLDFQNRLKWDYCHGLELQAILDVYDTYGDKRLFDYAVAYADTMIQEDGSILTYKLHEYNIDRVNPGKMLFRIYEQTKEEKYKKAIDLLRSQIDTHPRNEDGGLWHKKVYENQMWLDGIYMAQPFVAEYAKRNTRVNDYADVIKQITLAAKHTYNPDTDLYCHATDVSKREKWANPVTGRSAHTWGRAMGWYAMACVDALEFIPLHEPGREDVLDILNKLATQIKRTQDQKSGLWYQVIDRSGAEGNYLEATCSSMFVQALLKSIRLGYIDASYMKVAEKGYNGILENLVTVDENGLVNLNKCCAVAGLGGKNYRMGDYEYYINETIRSNDPKGIAPFIMASLEWERLHKCCNAKK
ncbi:MAG: glycoside hydrolase family 88/105 protein [Phocaeicola sp.]